MEIRDKDMPKPSQKKKRNQADDQLHLKYTYKCVHRSVDIGRRDGKNGRRKKKKKENSIRKRRIEDIRIEN